MGSFMQWLGNVANLIGVISAVIAVISWLKARKHAQNAIKALEVIQNYRRVEIYTEVNKKLEQIKSEIRKIGTDGRANVQKRYKELETTVGEIIHAIPLKNSDLIDKMREVEKALRIYGDKSEKLVDRKQYVVLDLIDYVTTGLKSLMEELRQEN